MAFSREEIEQECFEQCTTEELSFTQIANEPSARCMDSFARSTDLYADVRHRALTAGREYGVDKIIN